MLLLGCLRVRLSVLRLWFNICVYLRLSAVKKREFLGPQMKAD
jgi:hypothetical protein